MKKKLNSILIVAGVGLPLGALAQLENTTWSYDFDSQWSGFTQIDNTSGSTSLNWSKANEARDPSDPNLFAGVWGAAPGVTGDYTLYPDSGTADLSVVGNYVRLQESFSTFANQAPEPGTGTSELAQIGLFNPSGATTMTTGDSLYVGLVETEWNGATGDASDGNAATVPTVAGTAEFNLGLYSDGVKLADFGTFSSDHWGARDGTAIYAEYIDFDVYFEHSPTGDINYIVGANSVDWVDLTGTGSISVSAPTQLGVWSGSVSASSLDSLGALKPALGSNWTNSDTSITGATWDYSPSGDIFVIPEPSSMLLGAVGAALLLYRRRR